MTKLQGPVVQSKTLTRSVFDDFIANTLKFFVEKRREKLLHCKSFSDFFDKNIGIFEIVTLEILTKR